MSAALKAIVHRHIVADHFHQLVVEDDDQRIDVLLQFGDAGFGHLQALVAFETERLGDHRHGQDTQFARHFGDDRRGTGTRAAAHAGGDEDHVRALQRLGESARAHRPPPASGFRLGAGTQTRSCPDDSFSMRDAALERLGIGVGGDELDAIDPLTNHVIDGIATGATDADHLDHGTQSLLFFLLDDFKHGYSPLQKTLIK